MNDPILFLDDSHRELNVLARSVGQLLRSEEASSDIRERETLTVRLEELRDELLEHFADEEEALFPFLFARMFLRGAKP